jgi:hypothetical protein
MGAATKMPAKATNLSSPVAAAISLRKEISPMMRKSSPAKHGQKTKLDPTWVLSALRMDKAKFYLSGYFFGLIFFFAECELIAAFEGKK